MRMLVIGGAGMLGHKLIQTLQHEFDIYAMVRRWHASYERYGIFSSEKTMLGGDVTAEQSLVRAFASTQPDVVVNCVGVIKQIPSAKDPAVSIAINALLPHRLADLCQVCGSRLIHISTDCVFQGDRVFQGDGGGYRESDPPDAADLYGRSKQLGEVDREGMVTLRTSIIGRELISTNGLVEWFLSQRGGEVRGFTQAIFSGLTTAALARVIANVATEHPQLSGIYQVATDPIDKCQLLTRIRDAMGIDVEITPDSSVAINRSLDSERFRTATGIDIPGWEELIGGLASDDTPYDAIRADAR